MPEEIIEQQQGEDDFAADAIAQAKGAVPLPGQQQQQGEAKPEGNDELKKAMAELAGTVNKLATPKETPKEMSPEEQTKFWGIYDPTNGGARKDFFQKFFRLNPDATPEEIEDAKGLFADMQKGFVRQAIVGARNLMAEELQKMREEFSPAQEYASQARAEKTREKFFKQYPALFSENDEGDNQYAKVIDATARLLADKEFDSEAAYFKALAEGAAETIKTVLPSFDISVKTTKQPAGTTPRLPRTRVGGTGGTGTGATVGAKRNGSGDDSDSIDWS
jgi:hypothetical protein